MNTPAQRKLPSRNRVVACLGGARTAIEEREVPAPGDDELLLRVRVVGLCGTDLFKLASGGIEPGTVLGHELVGEVAAAGADVTHLRPGDRVAVPHHVACGRCLLCRRGAETMCAAFKENLLDPGGFAEHVLVKARATRLAARKLPAALGDDTAVFIEPAACVLRGIERAGLAPDGLAVIQGAGSMGLLHLLVLRALHPTLAVHAIDPLPARRELALALGADAASPPDDEAATSLAADAVFDTVGGAAALASALERCRHGGAVILFAHASAGERAGFELNELFKNERRIIGSYSGSLDEQNTVFELMASGRLDPSPLVTHRLALEDFDEGVRLAQTHAALKVLFAPERRR